MTLPAELQVGRRAARPRRKARWMAAHDRIRLTGRLRKAPAQAGAFYLKEAPGRGSLPPIGGSGLHSGLGLGNCGNEEGSPRMPTETATRRKKQSAEDAYCPHCHLLIEKSVGEEWPKEPLRCPHCRLLVGTGRARPEPSAEPGARGSAAGVFAHEAKRAGSEQTVSKAVVCRAIRDVAESVGARPERLLMVDYQQQASDDDDLPGLDQIFAAYGSWKRARRAAATSA
jgi:hypothetical protein